MSAMAKLFSKYVKNGVYTIEQVPATWRAEVEQILAEEEQANDGDAQPAVEV
ncbi:CD1375 family protein [Streptococcus parasuis]|uniref:CD1375 family protein n=1 Tax=Streptococcus parasuis TaxID=1501662 RepID=UPI002FE4217C